METCDRCGLVFDSEQDPDAYVEVPWLNLEARVWCEPCRGIEFDRHDKDSFYAEREL